MPPAPILYTEHPGIKNHGGTILALAVTDKFLASGGSQGTRIWSVDKLTAVARPIGASNRGSTCKLLWVRRHDESGDLLFSGTQNGCVLCWVEKEQAFEEAFVERPTGGGEITGMAYDPASNRLSVCTREDVVQVWTIITNPTTRRMSAQNVFSVTVKCLAPQAITFAAYNDANDRDVVVFGLGEAGPICTLKGNSGEVTRQWLAGTMIGDMCVNWQEGLFCLDDPSSGPTLYRAADEQKIRTFEIANTQDEWRPRTVRFAHEGSTVVCGSDHGVVYLFHTRTGAIAQKLTTGTPEWVQVVATTTIGRVPAIFAASTRDSGNVSQIVLWKKARRSTLMSWGRLAAVLKTLVILGCIAFLYQNLGVKIRRAAK